MRHFHCLANRLNQFAHGIFATHYKKVKLLLDTVPRLLEHQSERYGKCPSRPNYKYYAAYLRTLKFYLDKGNRDNLFRFMEYFVKTSDAEAIHDKRVVRKLLNDPKVLNDIEFIDNKFRSTLKLFDTLDDPQVTFAERISCIDNFRNSLINDETIGRSIIQDFNRIFRIDPLFESLIDYIKNHRLDPNLGTLSEADVDCLLRTPTGAISSNHGIVNLDIIWNHTADNLMLNNKSINQHVVIQCFMPYVEVRLHSIIVILTILCHTFTKNFM